VNRLKYRRQVRITCVIRFPVHVKFNTPLMAETGTWSWEIDGDAWLVEEIPPGPHQCHVSSGAGRSGGRKTGREATIRPAGVVIRSAKAARAHAGADIKESEDSQSEEGYELGRAEASCKLVDSALPDRCALARLPRWAAVSELALAAPIGGCR